MVLIANGVLYDLIFYSQLYTANVLFVSLLFIELVVKLMFA